MSLVTSGYQEFLSSSSWIKRCAWKWVMAKSNQCHRIGQVFVHIHWKATFSISNFHFFFFFVHNENAKWRFIKKDIYSRKTRFCLYCKHLFCVAWSFFEWFFNVISVFFFCLLNNRQFKNSCCFVRLDEFCWWFHEKKNPTSEIRK